MHALLLTLISLVLVSAIIVTGY